MTIEHRRIQGPIYANMVEANCFTCWSAGTVVAREFNGYEGSEPISHTQEFIVEDATKQHEKKKGEDHNIVIYHFKNDPVDHNDHTYRDGELVIEDLPKE